MALYTFRDFRFGWVGLGIVLCLQAQEAPPAQVLVSRYWYRDYGPPYETYEIYSAHSTEGGTRVERIVAVLPIDHCVEPPIIEADEAVLPESLSDLLSRTNLCAIPESELGRGLKPCITCGSYEGSETVMQIRCGSNIRRIATTVQDRDLDALAHGRTGKASWAAILAGRFNSVLPLGVMGTPFPGEMVRNPLPDVRLHPLLRDWAGGKFDELFLHKTESPSGMFRLAENPPPPPVVELVHIEPVGPTGVTLPVYPPRGLAFHISGDVEFAFKVRADGSPARPYSVKGEDNLRDAVEIALAGWMFSPEAAGKEIRGTIRFHMNCPALSIPKVHPMALPPALRPASPPHSAKTP